MKITLKDGSSKEYAQPMSVYEIALDISEGLARVATAGEIDGEEVDLRTVVDKDCELNILTFNDEKGKGAFRHTASHIMAQAIKRLYPDAKLAIGPSIADGFYYDIDKETPLTAEDLDKIEAEMKKIVKENLEIKQYTMPREEAIAYFKEKNEPYKVELIEDLPEGETISFYSQGEFTDLCAGPHLMTTKPVKAFKLTSLAGAYWRGDEHNKMLQRVYGTAFSKKAELEEYLTMIEEAKKRDHRKLGKELGLFMMREEGPGFPFFLPNGMVLKNTLLDYWREIHRRAGYVEINTPIMLSRHLWETSGHWDHYKENMFPPMEMEGESFVLRPMNCPHHMMIYANRRHSYKDLPIRIGEIAHDFRYESSGTLKGIERGRHFCQNDAHLFVTPEQIKDEFTKVVDLIFSTYKDFGIENYRCVLSLRDPENKEKYHDDDEMWNKAEAALRDVMNGLGIEYTEEIGEAAFYGPKLDVNVQPAVGNEITLSTCQLDFCLPAKFHLSYIDRDGEKKTPVVLHRAILGSLDRFMAYILEETKGNLPTWLAPVQVRVMPVKTDDDSLNAYAKEICDALKANKVRVDLDDRSEKLGYRMREGQIQKVPYLLVVGFNEKDERTVSFRLHGEKKTTVLPLDEFVEKLDAEIKGKLRTHIGM